MKAGARGAPGAVEMRAGSDAQGAAQAGQHVHAVLLGDHVDHVQLLDDQRSVGELVVVQRERDLHRALLAGLGLAPIDGLDLAAHVVDHGGDAAVAGFECLACGEGILLALHNMELAHDVRIIGDEDGLGFKLLVAQGDFGRGEHATRLEILGLQRQLRSGEGFHVAGIALAIDVEVEVLADVARHA
ncbi:hypothetical protein G6F31_018115 [Rhizopus arrhizus]|nr:hypothetical protein G6F31_018115 [Rhizopus arrhizus]